MTHTAHHPGSAPNSFGLLVLRLVVGVVFGMHGVQKFVDGLPTVAGVLVEAGIQPSEFWAAVLTVVELGGGLALVCGVLTRAAALGLGVTMGVAIATVVGPRGFFLPGYEFTLTLLGASLALAFTGPGQYALDWWLGLER